MTKEMPCLFQVDTYTIDLSQITFICINRKNLRPHSRIRIRDHSFEDIFSDDQLEQIQAAWVAYKGLFRPEQMR